jgi:signal transduction histidine kinase
MKVYRSIGNYFVDNNPGIAIKNFENAIKLSEKLNDKLALANNYYSIAYCYRATGDYNKSLEHYLKSVRIYELLKDNRRLANAFMSIAIVYSYNKDFKNTNEYHNKAQQLIDISKDSSQLCALMSDRGTLYDQRKIYDTALQYLQKAYSIANAIKDESQIIDCLSNIGLTYKHQGKTDEALATFDKVLLLLKNKELAPDRLAAVYNNIGATYAQALNKDLAKPAFDKSIRYSIEAQNPYIEMENYNNLSDMFGKSNNFKEQSFYLKKYYNIKDSLFTSDSKNKLTQLDADYNIEKKNIELVKKEGEFQKQKNEKNLLFVLAICSAIILMALAFFYRRINNKNILLGTQNVQINNQKNELQTLNGVKDRLFSIISHDLRNPLVTLRSYLSLTDNPMLTDEKKAVYKNQTTQAVTQTTALLDNLLVWANMQIKDSRPNITIVDIEEAILDAVDNINVQAIQKKISINKTLHTTSAIGDLNIITIAVRNLLTNALKYSNENSSININSFEKDKEVLIEIIDEGIGMDAEKIKELMSNEVDTTLGTAGEKGTGLGIFLVRELLQKINGVLSIESKKGAGSVFTIRLPSVNS